MSDLLEHLADLPIASFMQRDLEPGIVSFLDHTNLRRCCAHALFRITFFRNGDSRTQAAKLLFFWLTGDFHQVGLGNVRRRLRQLVCQITVIREQQQAFAVEI